MYCTLDDVKKQVPETKLIQITETEEAPGVIDEAAVESAIEMAQAEIDAYAAAQYPVPFALVPKIITKFAVDIALYNLFSGHGFSFEEDSPDKIILQRYKDAVKFLEKLSEGAVSIGGGSAADPATAGVAVNQTVIQNPPRLFNRDTMKGY
ncbi:DUF1320 domain-containing protein [Sporomusa sphaeroides DSM 2875]|uniref:gp436 family protein n=1 Tax=Sporomusa sphaeroides TaxID=47679 RepID=UPI0020301C5A|nr:DUF1320 domain-containing protein [Sporomusa sphaeroides]MCM0757352.1 DUF1320 domain-containing protein [Sporomusa sphaeroides DSM 2875]